MTDNQLQHSPSPYDLSSSSSVVSSLPFPPPGPLFALLLTIAFELGILTPDMLRKKLSPKDVLVATLRDKARAVGVYLRVMLLEGPFAEKFAAQLDLERMIADLSLAASIDTEAAERLNREIVVDVAFFIEHMPLGDIYGALVVNLLKEDSSANRACAVRLLEILVEYQAFGNKHETMRHIMKSIGFLVLVGDKVPVALRARMLNAVYQGGKRYRNEPRPMYALIFDNSVEVGGVTFSELAEHLPVTTLVRPFGAYVDKLGLVKTDVERPSELPPPGVLTELGVSPPIPVPRTPRLPVPIPDTVAASDDPVVEVVLPTSGG